VSVELRGRRIAVTGATGFLGRYMVDTLLARGARVIGVVRNPDRVPELAARGVELRRADLAERDRLAQGFAGADAVVSNAALFSLRNARWRDHEDANIRGTQNVFDAIADAGVKRVVHVSSVAVYSGHRPPVDEDAPQLGPDARRSFTNVYAISKALSEQLAWRLAERSDLALTAVRPCAIYGAFDPNFTAVFRRLIGFPVTVMPTTLRLALVYAGDVAEAIARALERPASAGRAYNVTGDDLALGDFARAWREAGGRAGQLFLPIPVPFVRMFDNGRAVRELGWRNRPFVDALRETFALERAEAAHAASRSR
jgi:nucleoside-diphosphate-sugar epimerase